MNFTLLIPPTLRAANLKEGESQEWFADPLCKEDLGGISIVSLPPSRTSQTSVQKAARIPGRIIPPVKLLTSHHPHHNTRE